MSGNGAGRTSWPRCGAHDRQRASTSFQQFGHVYCRQDMQKLNVLWNASSWCDGQLAVGLAAGRGHRLVHRRLVGQDEVLEAARQDLHALERACAGARTRRCSACHTVRRRIRSGSLSSGPRISRGRRSGRRAAQAGREYSAGSSNALPPGVPRIARRTSWVARSNEHSGSRTDPLVDSATDHAASHRHRAVLRTPL